MDGSGKRRSQQRRFASPNRRGAPRRPGRADAGAPLAGRRL